MREVTRHACVERVDCAEIDGMVPEVRCSLEAGCTCTSAALWTQVSRRFFPEVAIGFEVSRSRCLHAAVRAQLTVLSGPTRIAQHLRRA